jgi:hypothetical protein
MPHDRRLQVTERGVWDLVEKRRTVWLKELARGRSHASKISPRGKVAERSSQGTMRLGGEEQPADHARRRGAARPREIYWGSKMSPRRRGGEQVGISSNGHKDQKSAYE